MLERGKVRGSDHGESLLTTDAARGKSLETSAIFSAYIDVDMVRCMKR